MRRPRRIQLREAKATFSATVDQAERGRASVITRHGKPAAVIIGYREWERLSRVPSFGRLLMASPLEKDDLSPRQRAGLRASFL